MEKVQVPMNLNLDTMYPSLFKCKGSYMLH
jgi:hypothetical protein